MVVAVDPSLPVEEFIAKLNEIRDFEIGLATSVWRCTTELDFHFRRRAALEPHERELLLEFLRENGDLVAAVK